MTTLKFKYRVLFITISVSALLIACNEETPAEIKEIIIEKTVVENVDSAAIVKNDTNTTKLEEEVLGLTKKNDSKKHTISSLHNEVKELKTENDSLMTTINQKNRVISSLATTKQKKISSDELANRSLIQNLNNAWIKLPGSENTDEFLSLFLPDFGVSMVSIGIDDKANVQMMYKGDFIKLLNSVRVRDKLTIQIGNVNFLYAEGRNDIYTTIYTAVLRSYIDNVATTDRTFSATVTAKKEDGEWKIGKYSWVAMGHDLR